MMKNTHAGDMSVKIYEYARYVLEFLESGRSITAQDKIARSDFTTLCVVGQGWVRPYRTGGGLEIYPHPPTYLLDEEIERLFKTLECLGLILTTMRVNPARVRKATTHYNKKT